MGAVWTLHYSGGSTHTLQVERWNITRTRGEAMQWSITLANQAGAYSPAGSIGQYFVPYERTGGSPASWVTVALTSGGDTWNSPKLVILDCNWDFDPEALKAELSGTDPTELLLNEGIMIGDLRSTSSTVYTANGAISQICQACAIDSGDIDTSGLANYNLPVFHAVGQALQLIRELLELMQGWFYWDGSTIKFISGGINPDSLSANYTLTESASLKICKLRKSSTGIYNKCTVERVGEVKQGYGPEMGFSYGSITINLATPLNEAILVVEPYGEGSTDSWTWYDDTTPLVMAPTPIYRGVTPTNKVTFNLTPSVAWGANPMAYKVEVRGHNSVDEVAPYEEAYSATYSDAADQAVRGVIPFPEPITLPGCPDQATAAVAAEKKVKELLLSYQTVNVDLLLNVTHTPGHICALNVDRFGWTAKKFLVETVEWSGDATQEIETLELARGAA